MPTRRAPASHQSTFTPSWWPIVSIIFISVLIPTWERLSAIVEWTPNHTDFLAFTNSSNAVMLEGEIFVSRHLFDPFT